MVKHVVGAHYGLSDWLVQRVTALLMAVYTVGFLGILLVCPPQHYGEWRGLFENQPMRIATFLFFVSLFWHAWIGVRDIVLGMAHRGSLNVLAQVMGKPHRAIFHEFKGG